MKTCDEMLESVLSRAKVDIAKRKQRNKTILQLAATGLCLALVLGLTLAPWSPEQPPLPTEGHIAAPPTPSTDPTQSETTEPTQEETIAPAGGIYLLTANSEGPELTLIQPDMTYALDRVFRVFPLKSAESPEEVEQIQNDAEAFYNDWVEKYYDGISSEGQKAVYRSQDMIYYDLSAGFTSFILPDYTKVLKVERESTGVLNCGKNTVRYFKDEKVGKGENAITIPAGSYRQIVDFTLGIDAFRQLDADPHIPLSTFNDTFTYTIHYVDGTKEILIIDISFGDEGQVYMTLRGNSDM